MIEPIKFPHKKFGPENHEGEKKTRPSPLDKTSYDGKKDFEKIYEKGGGRGERQEEKIKQPTEKFKPFVEKREERAPPSKRQPVTPAPRDQTPESKIETPESKVEKESVETKKEYTPDASWARKQKYQKADLPKPEQPKIAPQKQEKAEGAFPKEEIDVSLSPDSKISFAKPEIGHDKLFEKMAKEGEAAGKAKLTPEQEALEKMRITTEPSLLSEKEKGLSEEDELIAKKGSIKDESLLEKFQSKLAGEKGKGEVKETGKTADKKTPPAEEEFELKGESELTKEVLSTKEKQLKEQALTLDKAKPDLQPVRKEVLEGQKQGRPKDSPFSVFGQMASKPEAPKEKKVELPPVYAAETLSQSETFPGLPKEKGTEKESTDKVTGRFDVEQHDLSYVNPVITPVQADVQTTKTETERVRPVISPQEVKEIVDRIAKELYTLTQAGRTDTVIILQHPPMLNKVQVVITEFDSAAKQLNLSFENLTGPAKQLLDNQMESLKKALSDEGIKTQMITTTTEIIHTVPSGGEASAHQEEGRGEREGKGGQQGGGRQGGRQQQEQEERE